MSAKPKYYNVSQVAKTEDGKDTWTKVGVMFQNKNSFKLRLNEGVSVKGDLVITLPKASKEQEAGE